VVRRIFGYKTQAPTESEEKWKMNIFISFTFTESIHHGQKVKDDEMAVVREKIIR
jgi:hypothetical protein